MSDFTDEEVTAATKAVTYCVNSPTLDDDIEIARAVLAAVLPAHDRRVKAEALRELQTRLMDMDGAGEFGVCCADPDCRACSVLETINAIIENGADDENGTPSPSEKHRRYLERGGWNG